MYDALTIARYVVNYCNQNGYGISNLKLQKLLYFIQAYFVAFTDEKQPCFREEIEAWDFGPVVPEVYHEFKQFGSNSIPSIEYYYETDGETLRRVKYDRGEINKKDQENIDLVINQMAKYSASSLVELTHNQAPWKDAHIPHSHGIITIDSLKGYFKR